MGAGWLREVLTQPAADAARRGKVRMARLLGLLDLNPQPVLLGVSRADFMKQQANLKLVEVNTISAAFTASAPVIQKMLRNYSPGGRIVRQK